MPSGAAAGMEPEPEQPKAAAGGAHRKHLAMLERLSKRSSSSAAGGGASSDSAGASPVEAFLTRFAAAKGDGEDAAWCRGVAATLRDDAALDREIGKGGRMVPDVPPGMPI